MLLQKGIPVINLQFINFNNVWNNWIHDLFAMQNFKYQCDEKCLVPVNDPYLGVPLLAILSTALFWLVSLLLFGFPSSFIHFCHILVIVNLQFYLLYRYFLSVHDNKFIFFFNFISVVDCFMKWKCNDLQNMEDT